jgi:hypothetical protein
MRNGEMRDGETTIGREMRSGRDASHSLADTEMRGGGMRGASPFAAAAEMRGASSSDPARGEGR